MKRSQSDKKRDILLKRINVKCLLQSGLLQSVFCLQFHTNGPTETRETSGSETPDNNDNNNSSDDGDEVTAVNRTGNCLSSPAETSQRDERRRKTRKRLSEAEE
ncbi:hypothetical protein JOB18_034595 [Solea senegalensis]|uniref:Uncharacterized protein n=1 Tax=Solea senegalensis TaxID=28829 RepID=A0AAV6PKF6_SOLSE|nr:hypothetical protein JOB18_034595 [Solea senegalensis]